MLKNRSSQIQKERSKEDARKRKVAIAKLDSLCRPDNEKSEDVFDVCYKSGKRAVVSGGLPSLGKGK